MLDNQDKLELLLIIWKNIIIELYCGVEVWEQLVHSNMEKHKLLLLIHHSNV